MRLHARPLCCALLLLTVHLAGAAPLSPEFMARIEDALGRGHAAEADRLIRAALLDNPNDTTLHLMRGVVLVVRGELNPAEDFFREAVRKYPADERFVMNLAEILYRKGNFEEAIPLYARIPANSPTRPLALYKQILAHLLAGDRPSAAALVNGVQPAPQDPCFYYAHAALAFHDGDLAAGRYFSDSALRLYAPSQSIYRLALIERGWITQ